MTLHLPTRGGIADRTRTASGGTRWLTLLLAAVVAAAVIAAVVIAIQVGRPSATPKPLLRSPTESTPFPVGASLRTWVDPNREVLYINGVLEPGVWGGASSVADLTLGFTNDFKVGVFLRGARIGTLHHAVDGVVQTSPDGRTIAWIEFVDGSVHLVAATVANDGIHELGRLPLDPAILKYDTEGSERVMKVDDDHTVTYGGVTGGHSWRPGSGPKDADVSILLTRARGFPNTYEPPDLNPSGTWGAWRTTSTGRSPHEEETPLTAVTVQQPNRPGTRFTFAMPGRVEVQSLFWETETDVIVAVSSGGDDYVRCHVLDHRCEYAPVPGTR